MYVETRAKGKYDERERVDKRGGEREVAAAEEFKG